MRMSCNGCRVLRKGCGDDCSIRPCLDWIKTADSQGNATVFLAKFYGRAGLMNLVDAGPPQLRPAIFRSLLYEACGRIVNPIYGAVGLIWSGRWQLCQDAVDAVLRGDPITQIAPDASGTKDGQHLIKAYDIRRVCKEGDAPDTLQLMRNRRSFKRTGAKADTTKRAHREKISKSRSPSHESSLSHQSEPNAEQTELGSAQEDDVADNEGEVELDLTLGFEPFKGYTKTTTKELVAPVNGSGICKMELGLDYPASASCG